MGVDENEGNDSNDDEANEARNIQGNRAGTRPRDESRPQGADQNLPEAHGDDHGKDVLDSGRKADSPADGQRRFPKTLGESDIALLEKSVVESHSGPVPSAKEMGQYAKIDSTLPNRMMRMAEKQQDSNIRIADRLSLSEALSVPAVSIIAVLMPWVVCIISVCMNHAIPAWVGGGAGFLMAAAQLVRSIKGKSSSESEKEPPDSGDDM